jgi:asparagine synthase (glutamine-hydrolysing)
VAGWKASVGSTGALAALDIPRVGRKNPLVKGDLMCGIAGLVDLAHRSADPEVLRRMIQVIRHRGPDETGVQVDGPVGLAHARLSILDLAGGKQPMSNEDGSIWITFNGEIFNHVELRERLARKGHVFRTLSDTEVIVHAYEQYGDGCVQHFNGQWAFAIWDAKRRRLFLSRDRLGVRPLFYAQTPEAFVFGSEIKALFAQGIPREVDVVGLDQLLTFWSIMAPRTFFKHVRELPPGHSAILQDGALSVAQYWQLDFRPDSSLSEQQHAHALIETLVDASRLRLRADVPVGAYLSGGLDSTLIASVVHRHTQTPLRTFSVTFEDAEYDESHYQAEAIRYLQVDHRQVLCRAQDMGRAFPDVVWHTEQPLVRTAPVPLYLLSKLVRDSGYKVVLTGEGADELLGGYDIFKEAKIRRFWAAVPDSRLRPKLLRKLYPYMTTLQSQSDAYLKAFFCVRPQDLSNPFFSHLPRWELTSQIKRFYSAQVADQLHGYSAQAQLAEELPDRFGQWDPFCQAQFLESRYLLPGYLLSSQGDRVAMAHSVEGRYPFLDYRVAEVASRIPPQLKMKVLNEKYILKLAAADLIPPFVRKRPKQPYRAPDIQCFFDLTSGRARHAYVEELLSRDRLTRGGLFHPDSVGRLVEKVRSGRAIGVRDGMALVAILSAQLVMEQFIHRFGRMSHGDAAD